MKAVILAGGFGSRISEESHLKPKPMIEIGEMPIMWHIMKIYSHYGVNDFIICAGYKQHIIKEYFMNYSLHASQVTFSLRENKVEIHANSSENWKVTVIDTGLNTMTGGRIKRIQPFLGNEPFFLTYGDGVADINIPELLEYHRSKGGLCTLSAVSVSQRFGLLDMEAGMVRGFREKENVDSSMINGGFMVCQPEVMRYIDDDSTVWEKEPMSRMAQEGKLFAYEHKGYWQCMDTQREKIELDEIWASQKAPWKVWDK